MTSDPGAPECQGEGRRLDRTYSAYGRRGQATSWFDGHTRARSILVTSLPSSCSNDLLEGPPVAFKRRCLAMGS